MKKIITALAVLLSINFASALTNTTNFHKVGSSNISSGDFGLAFTANNNTTITAVTKTTTTTVTKARIVNSSFVELGSATFVGDVATFPTPISVTQGSNYYVLINNGTYSFDADWGNVSSDLPSVNTDITFPLTNNAVFKTPYVSTITSLTHGGGNQLGITGIVTGETVTPPEIPPTSNKKVLFLGDSLTEGLTAPTPYPFLINKPSDFTILNLGVSSRTVEMINNESDTLNNTQLGTNKTDDIIVVWGGSADLYQAVGTQDAVTTFNRLKAFCLKEKALGEKVIVLTMLPRPNNTVVFDKTQYNLYNSLIRAHWTEFADGLADVQSDSRIGLDSSNYDSTYYNDTVHLNQAGFQIVADYVQNALHGIDSNFPPTVVTPPVLTKTQRLLNVGFTQVQIDVLLSIFTNN